MDADAALSVEELVDRTLDALVSAADPAPARQLLAELADRGEDATWEAVLLLLAILASRPVHGLAEADGVRKLEQVAGATPDLVTALVLALQAEHRPGGADRARVLWEQAPVDVRRLALLQLLIAVAFSFGSDHGRLTPRQTVALIKQLIVPTAD